MPARMSPRRLAPRDCRPTARRREGCVATRHRCAGALIAWLAACATFAAAAGEIALSFDDAPRGDTALFTGAERTDRLLAALERAGVEGAIFFAVGGHIDAAGQRRLDAYQRAGHFLGNHSATHRHPADLGLAGYVADIESAHQVLAGQPRFVPLYRFPFLDEGRDEAMRDGIRAALAEAGYGHGYVTVDNYDWYMDHLLQRALAAGRPVDWERLGEVYVRTLVDSVAFYDDIAVRALGRSPRHVLLLHENDLAALYVDDLVHALRERGWTIVPAPAAYEDPIARTLPATLFNGQGRVAALAAAGGRARRELVHEAEDEAWLEARFERAGVFGALPDAARAE